MTDLRKAAEMALKQLQRDVVYLGHRSKTRGDAIKTLRQALAQPEQEYVIDCPRCGHCCPNVDAINMSQERVDETAKRKHEPWPSVQCVCGGTIYFKYTPPVSDYHEGWEEGFKAATREQEPVAWRSWNDHDGYGFWETKQEAEPWCSPDFFAEPIYTAPPKREWAGLTDDEIYDYADKFLYSHGSNYGIKSFGKAIEAKLKEKNT